MDAIDLLNVLNDWKPRSELPHETKFAYDGEVFVVKPAPIDHGVCRGCDMGDGVIPGCDGHREGNLPLCFQRIFVRISNGCD